MATRKTTATTTRKKAPAKKAAPKPVEAPVVQVIENPAQKPVEHSVETGERAFVRGIQSDDLVRFRIPEDPFGEVRTWERSFNGHIIVLQAGREYELPLRIVRFIERSMTIQRLSNENASAYTNGMGKRI